MFERLTHRSKYGNAYTKIAVNESNMVDVGECYTGRIIDCLAAYEDSGLSPEHMHELAKAKAEGRLVMLPCKVGDTVYWADADGDEVLELPLMGYWVTVSSDGEKKIDGCVQAFGRNWSKPLGTCLFLTREEAEAALKEVAKNERQHKTV